MSIENINIGDSKNKVIEVMGNDIGNANINGIEILTFDSKVDNLANYVYLRDGKVVLVSQGKGKQVAASVDTLFPEIELPDKSYFYKPEQRATVVRYTIHIWEEKGLAVIIDGSQSNDKVERVLLFEPGNEQNLRSTWTSARYIGEQAVFIPVEAKTEFIEITQPGEMVPLASILNSSHRYVVFGLGIACIFSILGLFLHLKKKKKTALLNQSASTPSRSTSEAATMTGNIPLQTTDQSSVDAQITNTTQYQITEPENTK